MSSNRLHPGSAGRALLGALACAALAAGCTAGYQLVNLWKDPVYPERPLTNVLVVAMKQDAGQRRMWEDGLVAEFSKHGLEVTPSYRIFPRAVPDTDQVEDAVRAHGCNGVVLVHKLATERTQRYVPGYVTTVPVTRYRRWGGYYGTYFREVYVPGYVQPERVVRYQIDVWTTEGDGQLVWTAVSEHIDPRTPRDVQKQLAHLIVPELVKKGVIGAGIQRT
jgi:hypothetical protein